MKLQIQPRSGVNRDWGLRITELTPGAEVEITTTTTDDNSRTWESVVVMIADADGVVDAATTLPQDAAWAHADPFGPLWTMTPTDRHRAAVFAHSRRDGLIVTVRVRSEGEGHRATVTRTFGANTIELEVPLGGIRAQLFTLNDGAGHPPLLLLGGLEGGHHAGSAAALANHGFTVMALSYFGPDTHQPRLERIDLQEIDRAIDFLTSHSRSTTDPVGILAASRGCELAFQLACDRTDIGPVVALSPSAVRFPAGDAHIHAETPAWVRDGEPYPYLPDHGRGLGHFLDHHVKPALSRKPVDSLAEFTALLDGATPEELDAATIALERITGPLLLWAGGDDHVWPARRLVDHILDYADTHTLPYDIDTLIDEDAGHMAAYPFAFPGLPPVMARESERGLITYGGSIANNAAVARTTRIEVLEFLHRAYGTTPRH